MHNKLLKFFIRKILLVFYYPKWLLLKSKIIRLSKTKIVIFGLIGGIGDVCLSLSTLKELKKLNQNKEIIVLAPLHRKEIVSFYSNHAKIVYYSDKNNQIIKLQKNQVILFLKKNYPNIFFTYTAWLHEPFDMKQNVINEIWEYGFNIRYIKQELTFPSIDKHSSNKLLESNLFNSIIINKETTSAILENGEIFWNLLTNHLREKGYRVLINSSRNFIDNTGLEFFKCSLSDLYKISSKSLAVISIRSGLLDFLISSNVALINIMPSNNLFKKYFQLNQWKSNDKLLSINFDSFHLDIIKEIDLFLLMITNKNSYEK
jgi:hypothetical protein